MITHHRCYHQICSYGSPFEMFGLVDIWHCIIYIPVHTSVPWAMYICVCLRVCVCVWGIVCVHDDAVTSVCNMYVMVGGLSTTKQTE